jgi:DNA-binding winged helix-turn-helix (wHTH) protein
MRAEVYNRRMPIRFGDFAVDLDRRELRDRDGAIHLTPKAFELLQLLIASRPKVIPQPALYDALWPNTFVEPTNLHNLIREIRRALGDRNRKMIRTHFGVGFAFAVDAFSDDLPHATAQMFVADRIFDLHEGENLVGRERTATVRISSKSVSRLHARISIAPDAATVEDLRSKNGTYLRGRRLRSPSRIFDGDELKFGSVAAVFRLFDTSETETD